MGLTASLIWVCVLGLAVGNYATSFVFRMPRSESPFTKHPYCGGCGTMLAVKDLFPAVSWLLLRGKCRYCDMVIPPVYFWTEIYCALIFMLGVVSYGFSEEYLLVVMGGTAAVTLWGLEWRTGKLFYSVLMLLAALGLAFRILQDGTIFDALYGMIWGAGIPMAWWRFRMGENTTGAEQRLAMPLTVALGATAGLWLATFGLLLCVVLWGMLHMLYRLVARNQTDWPQDALTPAFCTALMALVLWPQLELEVQNIAISYGKLWLAA